MVSSRGDTFREPNLKLFVKDVREGKKRPIEVRSWSTIQNVKEILQRKIQVPTSSIRLFYGPLLTSGQELPNHRTLHDVGIYKSGETLLLDIKNSADPSAPTSLHASKSSVDIQISASMMESTPKSLRSLVTQARRGLSLGFKPELVLDGSGGTYILHDPCKRKIAVFKPSDEEPYAANNPRGYLRQQNDSSIALRAGVTPGEACMREVAAYLLDKGGFSGVPQTTLVEARHPTFNLNGARLNVSQGGASVGAHSLAPLSPVSPSVTDKAGSFQEFVNYECTIDDISPSKISAKEVHKIAILDIRIMNSDRNSANLLVRRRRNNTLELVPIDHGFCLRSVCDVCWMDWCWLDWPQLKEPLCDEYKRYIQSLDIESEAMMLRDQLSICEEAVDYFRASSALLKAGVNAGLTMYEIAIKCCRNDNLAEVPSMMEKLFDMASDLAEHAIGNDRYHHTTASRALVDQLSSSVEAAWNLKPPARSASRRFGRSVSNAELESSHGSSSDRSLYKHQEVLEDEPDMAHSSVSDSCSETETNDHTNEDECNKWAADCIAGLTEPRNMPRSLRASSIESCDSSVLSTSPGGFWTIPPGAAKAIVKTLDEDSIQWSPRSSEPRCPAAGFENVEPPPLTIGDADKSVTFSDTEFPFLPPDSLDNKPKAVGFLEPELSVLPETKLAASTSTSSTMKRSKSYTAMPAGGQRKTDVPVAQRGPAKSSVHYDQYKMYFHKFIDLVIVQETAARLS